MLARAVKQVDSPLSLPTMRWRPVSTPIKRCWWKKAAICTSNIWWRVRTIFRTRAFRNWRKRCILTPFVSSF